MPVTLQSVGESSTMRTESMRSLIFTTRGLINEPATKLRLNMTSYGFFI